MGRKHRPRRRGEEAQATVIQGPWRRRGRRQWDAAATDRLTFSFLGAGADINAELRAAIAPVRARARHLEQNDEYARRFLQLVETHVVGAAGFLLQVRAKNRRGDPDRRGSEQVEAEFREWSRVADIAGQLTFPALCRLAVRTCARDGECLIRLHDVRPDADNPFGFALEVLDPARLDHQYQDDLPGDRRVRLGVELAASGRPLAYHLLSQDLLSGRTERVRVAAEDLIHLYLPEVPGQLRGISWLAAAMPGLNALAAYDEAAVTAARVGAAKMGFYKSPDGGLHALSEQQEDGELVEDAEPGHFGHLPPGYDFLTWDPNYPHDQYADFTRQCLHRLAMGLGVSYAGLTGDLKDVNYSSIRAGVLEEREHWMVLQQWFIDRFLRPVYRRWLSAAVLNGRVGGRLAQEEAIRRYSQVSWQGRRWPWVDPLKDIQAVVAAIAAGLKSPQQVAAELGVDIEEILDQIARFRQQAEEKGVSLSWNDPGGGPMKTG